MSDILHEFDMDVCFLTETWLKDLDEDNIWIECCELNKNGYKLDISNRNDRKGGGTGLVYRDNLKIKTIDKGILRSFEFGNASSPSSASTILLILPPPYSSIPRSDLIRKTITTRKIKEINIEEFSDYINLDNIMTG